MTLTTIVPQTFAATVGNLVQYSGAMQSIANYMPGTDAADGIPAEMDPIVDLSGTDQDIDALESFSKLRETISSMNRGVSSLCKTVSMVPAPYREADKKARKDKGGVETDRSGMARSFSEERSHLQDLINMQVAVDAKSTLFTEGSDKKKIANFLLRLGLITGRSATELSGAMSHFGVRDWINGFERMGMKTFELLKRMAEEKIAENGPLMSGSPADIAQRLFEQGVLFSAIGDIDEYAKEFVEERFVEAAKFFEEAERTGSAAISTDLAAHVRDKLYIPSYYDLMDRGKAAKNPYASEAARLLHKSIEDDPETTTFGIRYLLGLHWADHAADWAAKQKLFGSSISFYKKRRHTRELAKAAIRESHAFAQRTDRVSRADWQMISRHLSLAIDALNEVTLIGSNEHIYKNLRVLQKEALRYAARAN